MEDETSLLHTSIEEGDPPTAFQLKLIWKAFAAVALTLLGALGGAGAFVVALTTFESGEFCPPLFTYTA